MTPLVIILIALLAAGAVGFYLRSRSGKVRMSAAGNAIPTCSRAEMLSAVGLDRDRPTVLHFCADWCGPCAAVRRVIGQVIGDLATATRPPAEIELDIDEHPQLAKELGVLSLPTTFIFDAEATERFRISGVPTAADLRAALAPLSA